VITVASIVEGDGEVSALPILLRRLGVWLTPDVQTTVLPPIRVHRDRFLNKAEEFKGKLLLAAAKCGGTGWILILLDADDDCPAEKGRQVLDDAQKLVPHRPVAVVMANREFEAWFIASACSLNGARNFSFSLEDAGVDPESPRDAKGWMRERMTSRTYREITDQPAFTARMDLPAARNGSRSFRKLCDEWLKNSAPT
jgi:hypothetical protein